MISFIINAASKFLLQTNTLKIKTASTNLPCRVVEINEQQDYNVPGLPIDSGVFISDNIYRQPLKLNVLVYVRSEDLQNFESIINSVQFSQELFTIDSLYNKSYNNLKIVSYQRQLNASMLNAMHFNLTFQEVIIIKALVESYKNNKNPSYTSKKNLGNKNPQKVKMQSIAFKGLKAL